MGTQIQDLRLDEAHSAASASSAAKCALKGRHTICLALTQPQAIEDIISLTRSPAPNILETQHFSSRGTPRPTSVAGGGHELNGAPPASPAAPRSRPSASTASGASSPARSGRPTAPPRSRPTSTIPASRAVTFDMLREAYAEQIAGLNRRRRRLSS